MPNCPICGDDYPAGGAIHSHVKSCAEDPDTPILDEIQPEENSAPAHFEEVYQVAERVDDLERENERLRERIQGLSAAVREIRDVNETLIGWVDRSTDRQVLRGDKPEWEKELIEGGNSGGGPGTESGD